MHDIANVAKIATIADITRHHAESGPTPWPSTSREQHLAYGELDRRTNRVANGQIADGVRPQTRVAILSKNTPAFFELWFGAAKADVVLVPVNFRLAPPEVAM
jgi:long-chain acyl-CoA synthetase